ncbi:Tim44-like domain protein [mine drainage metagenome]|uniref:Tim44-like domain protein n=1 Tax=mine drainage metagenome TaxID=410659 RepID=A0A1J5SCR6_9ZZZZ
MTITKAIGLLCVLTMCLHPALSRAESDTAPASGFLHHSAHHHHESDRNVQPPRAHAAPVGPAVQSQDLSLPSMADPRPMVAPAAPAAAGAAPGSLPGVPTGEAQPAGFAAQTSGALAGFTGGGIVSLLGGSAPFFGQGGAGFAGAMAQLMLLYLLVRALLRRLLPRRRPVHATAYRAMDGLDEPSLGHRHHDDFDREPRLSLGPVRDSAPTAPPLQAAPGPLRHFVMSETDLADVEALLAALQQARTQADGAALQRLCAPDLAERYLREARTLAADGRDFSLEDVRITKGDVMETWHEDGARYATIALQWTALRHSGRLGDTPRRVEQSETWTVCNDPAAPWADLPWVLVAVR